MKNLIVAIDGTWNSPDQRQFDVAAPTNVVRLYNCVAPAAPDGTAQKRFYISGVGSDGSWFDRLTGGAYGKGTSRIILAAYAWLVREYAPGDAIYLFGFSRGAFAARSLAGLVGCVGLPDLAALGPRESAEKILHAYTEVYMKRGQQPRPVVDWFTADAPAVRRVPPIQFVGVWDTVGALGVPEDLGVLDLFDDATKWAFHDTLLGAHVLHARHAMAIDELRSSFTPTLWTGPDGLPLNEPDADPPPRVRQLWFPGVHSDVGGGYGDCGLSDGALSWMVGEAARAGLAFHPPMVAQIRPNHHGLLHDSNAGGFKLLKSRPRNRPLLVPGSRWYHPSAWLRDADPPITQCPYHPTVQRLAPGQEIGPVDIHAEQKWNETGIFLEAGASYIFRADGEWLDKTVSCGPGGTNDGKFDRGEIVHLLGSVFGKVETQVNKLFGTPDADAPMTRRHEDMPWFSLVGVVANDGGRPGESATPDGSARPHRSFLIGAGTSEPLVIEASHEGYLYAYANDAWHFYGNNAGSVRLWVKRVA